MPILQVQLHCECNHQVMRKNINAGSSASLPMAGYAACVPKQVAFRWVNTVLPQRGT
jgi:hypothetical protein